MQAISRLEQESRLVRVNGAVRVLADRCSHMSGPLSGGELADGCLTCPWHGSVFRIADGSVARGPATRATVISAISLPAAAPRPRS